MMKKINISSQLFLIFVFVLLLAVSLFSAIALTTFTYTAESQVYSRLSAYSLLLNSSRYGPNESETALDYDDMEIEYIIRRTSPVTLEYKSSGFTEMISDEVYQEVTQDIADQLEKYGKNPSGVRVQGKKIVNGNYLYFVCQISEDRSPFTNTSEYSYAIVFTNNAYSTMMVKGLSLQLIAVFFVLVFFAVLVIYLWSKRFIKRITNIQNHILDLPKSKYQKSYVDDYADEIGDLSLSVETMRIEISQIEQTKQDMLQNLSHDFKTPIAVIKSYAEAIQDGVESTDALKIIIEQSDILKNKVTKLLQYNSLEYLDKSKEFEDVDMYELVNEVVLSYKHQTELKFDLDLEEGITFRGYRENWFTVVSNIIDNALRYAKSEIKIVLRQGRLRIYNDGEPIDEQFANSIFKPYEKGSKGQFGLGMSIVMKTVDFFEMNLKVQNENPVGVSFIIESRDRT